MISNGILKNVKNSLQSSPNLLTLDMKSSKLALCSGKHESKQV